MKRPAILGLALVAAILSACSTCGPTAGNAAPVAAAPAATSPVIPSPAVAYQNQKVLAVGYGALGGVNSQYTHGQQKLMAMRAAKIDAFRSLAEHVYGFRLWGGTAVSAFATQNDTIRTYVDTYIRGARLVNMTPVADGNYEATVELDLTPAFFSCVTSTSTCAQPTVTAANNCTTAGCVQPSVYYYSNP